MVFTGQEMRYDPGLRSGGSATATWTVANASTSPSERFLLFVMVMLLPLESGIRLIPNVSIMFLIFTVIAGYVAINRLWCLDRVWMHPVFVAAYVFVGITMALEFASPLSSYGDIGRFAQMIGGAVLVASLCRDRAALKNLMYGYLGAALWLGAVLVLTSYGTLSGVVATDYDQASEVRSQAFRDSPVSGNLNGMALACVQGGVVALAFTLGGRGVVNRSFFAAIGMFCLVASTLPMSRGAMVNAFLSVAVILKACGVRHGKVWLVAGLLAMSAVLLIPDAIWSRMTVVTEEGAKDPRFKFYEHALEHVDDYLLTGVGAGNYYGNWGFRNGFALRDENAYVVYGVHNVFLQLLINWGLIGLSAYLVIVWLAYRCIPERCGSDPLALSVLGMAVFLILLLPFIHNYYEKVFSFGLGMLVAYRRWLDPKINGTEPVGR